MDVLLKPCIEPIISYLAIPRHVGYLLNVNKNVEDMKYKMTVLNAMKTDVRNELEVAESNSQQPTEEVNRWLKEVAELEAKVLAVDIQYEQIGNRHPLHNFMLPNSWPSVYSCSSSAANFKDEVAKLVQERATITALVTAKGPDAVQRVAVGPSRYVGKTIDKNLGIVLNYLQDDTVGVLGIWGPGGVGKSTLLARINNSLGGEENLGFDYVIWVVASQDLQLDRLQQIIFKRLGLLSNSTTSQTSQIFKFLSSKNFLLLLDDLWKDFNLNEIGIPQPLCNNCQNQRKQKVILTTRFEGVCTRMNAGKAIIPVGCLEPKEALQLFREALGEINGSDLADIEKLKGEVAKECDGLPLALITIGKAMSNKKLLYQWEDTLRILKSHTGNIIGLDRLFSRLQISYDCLEDDTEKECFLFCSLWPEDYNVYKEELIRCWLGHGLIDLEEFETFEAACNRGFSIIDNLQEACLLEAGKDNDTIKMHDIIRDLAIRIVGKKKWIVRTVRSAEEASHVVAQWKEPERVYFEINNGYNEEYVQLQPPHCSNLSTLIFRYNSISYNATLDMEFLGSLPVLRYLDLSYHGCGDIPAVIGCLHHLEYLSFRCGVFKRSRLPDELANLSKLKYLIVIAMEGSSVIQIPNKVILKLQKLLVLDVKTGLLDTCKDPMEDYDVRDSYMRLHRMKIVSLKVLKICSLHALKLLSHVKVQELFISDLETKGQKTLRLQASNGIQQVEQLEISDCVALRNLVMDGPCLPRLQKLLLQKLPMLGEILFSGCLLRNLKIEYCHALKEVSSVLQLPSLEQLKLAHCHGMEYVIHAAKKANPTFVRLKFLTLEGLPQLRGICDNAIDFPALYRVKIIGCPELKTLTPKIRLATEVCITSTFQFHFNREDVWHKLNAVLSPPMEATEEVWAEEE